MAVTVERIAQLKRMRWCDLDRAALEAGVNLAVIKRAKTRDELRLAILRAEGGTDGNDD